MTSQLTLEFEPGLAERHKSLRECMVSCVYSRGLSNVADDLGKSPGNLSAELAEDSPRYFSIDSLERYLKKTGDMTPIHYLLALSRQSGGGRRRCARARTRSAHRHGRDGGAACPGPGRQGLAQ